MTTPALVTEGKEKITVITVLGASGQISAGLIVLLVILALWSTVWKGLALWKAARLRQTLWFVVLLVINTAGVLEILYIYIFSKRRAGSIARA